MKLNTNTSVGLRLPKMLGSGGNVQHTSLLHLTIKCGKNVRQRYKTLQLIPLNNKMRQNFRQGWKVLQNAPAYCALQIQCDKSVRLL